MRGQATAVTRRLAGGAPKPTRRMATAAANNHFQSGMELPLFGYKLLDFSSALSGPSATQYLADLGADVWKLEVPGKGDDTRSWGPPWLKHQPDAPAGHDSRFDFESTFFASTNRNKRSITADLKTEKDRQLALKLAAKADIIVENLITGKLAAFGLGYDAVKAMNPSVIYCSITGYGQTGEYAKAPGYDAIIAGEAGVIHCTGEAERLPVRPQVALSDHAAGFHACGAILAALIKRKRTGKGTHLDVSMFDCQVAGLSSAATEWLNAKKEYTRIGTASSFISPDQVFPIADGAVALCAASDEEFQDLAHCLGHEYLTEDANFQTNDQRIENRSALAEIIGSVLKPITTAQACERLSGRKFSFGLLNNLERAYSHPQVTARDLVSDIPHTFTGKVRLVNPPVKYNGESMPTRLAPPALGEHTADITAEVS